VCFLQRLSGAPFGLEVAEGAEEVACDGAAAPDDVECGVRFDAVVEEREGGSFDAVEVDEVCLCAFACPGRAASRTTTIARGDPYNFRADTHTSCESSRQTIPVIASPIARSSLSASGFVAQ
jgi:hypothetical protein